MHQYEKDDGEVKLHYYDEWGRKMTPKEAFRQLSWKFHGKGPGKKQQEKRMVKVEMQVRRLNREGGIGHVGTCFEAGHQWGVALGSAAHRAAHGEALDVRATAPLRSRQGVRHRRGAAVGVLARPSCGHSLAGRGNGWDVTTVAAQPHGWRTQWRESAGATEPPRDARHDPPPLTLSFSPLPDAEGAAGPRHAVHGCAAARAAADQVCARGGHRGTRHQGSRGDAEAGAAHQGERHNRVQATREVLSPCFPRSPQSVPVLARKSGKGDRACSCSALQCGGAPGARPTLARRVACRRPSPLPRALRRTRRAARRRPSSSRAVPQRVEEADPPLHWSAPRAHGAQD